MTVPLETDNNNKVNCLRGKHYAVTWNPKFPNACKLLGFKSAAMPSVVTYDSTGKMCEGFEKKDAQKATIGGINENLSTNAQAVIFSIGKKEERR